MASYVCSGKSGHAATRCPALDGLFPFMLPGLSPESTLGGFITCGGGAASNVKGFATRISSNVRPQDFGGGAPTMAVPRK